MKKLLFILFILINLSTYATIYYTAQNGSWMNTATWETTEPPNSINDTVYINHNIYIPTGQKIIYGTIIINDTLISSNNLIIAPNSTFYIFGYLYTSNHIWNFGHIILNSGNICWKTSAPPNFFHGNYIEGSGYICGYPYGHPLGIALTSFSAILNNMDIVEIKWTTENEENNNYFLIEKSKDLKNWIIVDIVKGSLISNGIINYFICDFFPYKGQSYYRLSQIDTDGTLTTYDKEIEYVYVSYDYFLHNNTLYINDTNHIIVYDIYGNIVIDKYDNFVTLVNYPNGLYIVAINQTKIKIIKQ